MKNERFYIGEIPAVLYGDENADRVWLFVHGKCGCKEEGEAFAQVVCPNGDCVLAMDLPGHGERKGGAGFDPWHAVPELKKVSEYAHEKWARLGLRANSIGAWFSMLALAEQPPERALLVSPLLDMEGLIRNMMTWSGVDEARLER